MHGGAVGWLAGAKRPAPPPVSLGLPARPLDRRTSFPLPSTESPGPICQRESEKGDFNSKGFGEIGVARDLIFYGQSPFCFFSFVVILYVVVYVVDLLNESRTAVF